MRRIITLLIIVVFVTSCSSLFHTTYLNEDIHIGESKNSILKKYGKPYSEDIYNENNSTIEVLCYKEIMAYGDVLKTYFYFQNNKLTKKTQREEERQADVILHD